MPQEPAHTLHAPTAFLTQAFTLSHSHPLSPYPGYCRNLLTPSTPDFFNTLYDPYAEGADFVRGYPFRCGVCCVGGGGGWQMSEWPNTLYGTYADGVDIVRGYPFR